MERDELFYFDWYLMARSAVEIERRVTMLLREIQRQQQGGGGGGKGGGGEKGKVEKKADGGSEGKVDGDGKVAGGGHKRKADDAGDAISKPAKSHKKKK